MLAQQVAEGAAVRVAPGVVRHQPFRFDPVAGEEGERPFGEGDDGDGALVGQQLGEASRQWSSTTACAYFATRLRGSAARGEPLTFTTRDPLA